MNAPLFPDSWLLAAPTTILVGMGLFWLVRTVHGALTEHRLDRQIRASRTRTISVELLELPSLSPESLYPTGKMPRLPSDGGRE